MFLENRLAILENMGSHDKCLEHIIHYLNASNGILSIHKYVELHPQQNEHTLHFIEHMLKCSKQIETVGELRNLAIIDLAELISDELCEPFTTYCKICTRSGRESHMNTDIVWLPKCTFIGFLLSTTATAFNFTSLMNG